MDYFIERWFTYGFILVSYIFSYIVYKMDKKFTMSNSNGTYMMVSLLVLFVIFAIGDYLLYIYRIKKVKSHYCKKNFYEESIEEFTYPMDKVYAKCICELSREYEDFKEKIYNESLDESDFITKWIHDIKVHISALRLILDNEWGDLNFSIYKDMDKEIKAIEEAIEKNFYHIKSKNFYNDYKLKPTSTKKMIGQSLKKYASIFSYKRININIEGEDYKVLTDEKWSGYIISQIISNGVKYTNDGGTIDIKTIKDDRGILIEVKNTGVGIDSKDISQIFKRGYTSSKERAGMKSTGYGMYLSKKISHMLGHEIVMESKVNEYAKFTLVFKEIDSIYNVTKV